MSKLMQEDIQALREPFATAAHSLHEGPANKEKTKCMWFVYLDRFAIIDRLDDLFPGEWEYTMSEPVQRTGHFSAVGTLTIRGVTRQFNGTQEIGTDNWSKAWDDEKGCGTDTFRRVASMWGIGAYLYNAPDTWTAKPGKNDWDAQKKAKAEVLSKLGSWLNREYGQPSQQGKSEPNGSQPPEATTTSAWPVERIDKLIEYWNKEGLIISEILRFAGITGKHNSEQWAKYSTNQDASAAIQAAWNAEMDNGGSAEESAVFNYMSYVGLRSNLLFATKPEGAKNNLVATAFEGRGGIRKWGSDELCEQLQLSQYDKIKGKNIMSDWIKMVVPVEFFYVFEQDGNDEYYKITGIKGNPEIAF